MTESGGGKMSASCMMGPGLMPRGRIVNGAVVVRPKGTVLRNVRPAVIKAYNNDYRRAYINAMTPRTSDHLQSFGMSTIIRNAWMLSSPGLRHVKPEQKNLS